MLLGGGVDFEAVLPAINRTGRDVNVRVVGSALRRSGDVRGAVLVMDVVPVAESRAMAELSP